MPRKSFRTILGNTHLVDNLDSEKHNVYLSSKLYKVLDFLQLLENNFQAHFDRGEKLTIDEMMIKFKRRSFVKRYIKQKSLKSGHKVWILADTSFYSLLRSEYTGIPFQFCPSFFYKKCELHFQ